MSTDYKVGDIIRFGYLPPYHYAVYIGDGEIVHYNRVDKRNGKASIMCEKITEYEKRKGKTYKRKVVTFPTLGAKYSAETIIKRAKNYVDHGEYNLLGKNCEHFATWVVYGRDISGQSRAVAVLGGTGGITVAGTGIGAATGAAIGATVGTFAFPVAGTLIGAGMGALIGTGAGAAAGFGVGMISSGVGLGVLFRMQKIKKPKFFKLKDK